MALLLIPATVFTLATLLLAGLWWLVRTLFRRRPAPGFWRRVAKAHLGLFVLHLFLTVPLVLAIVVGRFGGTRPDESRYTGPRIAADGSWTLQSRESLAAEGGPASVPQAAPKDDHTVWLTARDGVKLRAFLVPPRPSPGEDGPRFVAVLVHGRFRGGLEIETPGEMLRDLGGEVLLLELRNHGGSGRARVTFGRDEALDVQAAVEFLRSRPESQGRPLVLYAVSLGTAAVALALPDIPDVAGLVLDAPMDDLAATARRELGSGPWWRSVREPWASTLLFFAERVAGIPIRSVKPRDALAQLRPETAVLFIGAGIDDRMPPETVRALFDTLPTRPERKELWIEPEATHGKVWVKAPEEYRRHLALLCQRAAEGLR